MSAHLKQLLGAAGRPFQYVGSASIDAVDETGWDATGEGPDVLAIAQTGDLVVLQAGYGLGSTGAVVGGMAFTDVYSTASGYIGYAFVSSGDENPYLTSGTADMITVLCTVWRGVSSVNGFASAAATDGLPPNPPNVAAQSGAWIALGSVNEIGISFTAPTNYTYAGEKIVAVQDYYQHASAYREFVAASEDPARFGSTAKNTWFAATLGIS